MSDLLKKIMGIDREAARVLEGAGLYTDSDIRSLTRHDLHELFPGIEKFKLRKAIFEKIQKQKPVGVVLRELKAFIPHEYIRAALTNNGVLADYLHILKDMKTQMNNVQSFLDAHIGFLEELSKNQPDEESDEGSMSGTSAPGTAESLNGQPQGVDALGTHGQMVPYTDSTHGHPQGAPSADASGTRGQMVPHTDSTHGHPQRAPSADASGTRGQMVPHTDSTHGHPQRAPRTGTSGGQVVTYTSGHQKGSQKGSSKRSRQDVLEVKYRKVISGKTFDADIQLIHKVMSQVQGRVHFIESNEDAQTAIVFCPISSRVGSDVDAAMADVKDDKPVILVLMYHSREVRCTTSVRTWQKYDQVVLHVNVFYHETKNGLLSCPENNCAISEIQNKLLEYGILRSIDTSGNAVGAGGESGWSGSTPDGNNTGSDVNSSGSLFGFAKPNWLFSK